MIKLIDGNGIGKEVLESVKKTIEEKQIKPRLDIILIGDNISSEVYVKKKMEAGKYVGIEVIVHKYDSITDDELGKLIINLAEDSKVNGIILQLPAPHIDVTKACKLIPVEKDVDGLNPATLGYLWNNLDNVLVPATAKAVISALKWVCNDLNVKFEDYLEGKNIVIVNRSIIIGKPLAALFTNLNATVTIAHSKTRNLNEMLKTADIIISGVGQANFINSTNVKKDAIVIDTGFNRENGKVFGDVNSNEIKDIASYLSPVPGGIGPMGVASLIENTLQAFLNQM